MRETAERVAAAVTGEDLDRVFQQTAQLHDVAALHFVSSICCVCKVSPTVPYLPVLSLIHSLQSTHSNPLTPG